MSGDLLKLNPRALIVSIPLIHNNLWQVHIVGLESPV